MDIIQNQQYKFGENLDKKEAETLRGESSDKKEAETLKLGDEFMKYCKNARKVTIIC